MKFKAWKSTPLMLAALAIFSACGNSNFQGQAYSADASAGNQAVYTKPKVDIVFFQDDSDSVIFGPINVLKPQMQNFVNGLNSNVDYRFIVLPMLSSLSSVSSKFVLASDCSARPGNVSRCLTPDYTSYFNNAMGNQSWITTANSSIGSDDRGFVSMRNNLNQLSGFLRPDAPTLIVALTNGNDKEGAKYSTCSSIRCDGYRHIYDWDNTQITRHADALAGLKGRGDLKFYPVIARGANCYGSGSENGSRYELMADLLNQRLGGGHAEIFGLCDGGLNVLLNEILKDAKTLVQMVRFDKVVIDESYPPKESSIEIFLDGKKIPREGWSFDGSARRTVNTSYYPEPGNAKTGWVIQLDDAYHYQGTSQIKVYYTK